MQSGHQSAKGAWGALLQSFNPSACPYHIRFLTHNMLWQILQRPKHRAARAGPAKRTRGQGWRAHGMQARHATRHRIHARAIQALPQRTGPPRRPASALEVLAHLAKSLCISASLKHPPSLSAHVNPCSLVPFIVPSESTHPCRPDPLLVGPSLQCVPLRILLLVAPAVLRCCPPLHSALLRTEPSHQDRLPQLCTIRNKSVPFHAITCLWLPCLPTAWCSLDPLLLKQCPRIYLCCRPPQASPRSSTLGSTHGESTSG